MCDPHHGYDSKLCKSNVQTSECMSIAYHLWEGGGIVGIFSAIFWLSYQNKLKTLWSGYLDVEWGNIKQVMSPQTCQWQVKCALLTADKNANLTWNRDYFVLPCFKEVFLIFGVTFSTYLPPPSFFSLEMQIKYRIYQQRPWQLLLPEIVYCP